MTLLGHVLELKAGTDYETLMIDRICRPLKMEDTRISLTPQLKSRLATGHDNDGKPAPPYKLQVIAPAGALLSTANDLLKYLSTNLDFNQTGLNPLLREMQVIRHTRGVIGTQDMGRTAMPWCDEGVYNPPGANLLGHAGGCPGYSSFIGFDLERRRGVVVLSSQKKLRPACTGWQILQGMPLTTDNMHVREHLGIGIALTFDDTAKRARISNVFLKSPASEAGLTKGLLIRKINGTDVDGKQANECFDLMRGPAGTSIRLDVVDSQGKETTVDVTKRKFLTLT
jgi:CubicO group peptidase (beta-lactamase class C family)